MFYERQIKYLDYLVNRERRGNAGFVKLEVRGEACNINISVNGLETTDSFPVKVYIAGRNEERELCTLELAQGRGMKQLLRLDAKDIAGTGISYHDLEAVRIPVGAERELNGVLEKPVGQVVSRAELKAATEEKAVNEESSIGELEQAEEEKVPEDVKRDESILEMAEPEEKQIIQNQSDSKPRNAEPKHTERKMPLHDNKWKQLWEIYPRIRPFRDSREYLSVGPNDFVILPEKYFRMANNSFLLHGYYNYKHLILKRMEGHGGPRYYIGVPGNFYDREKQVAVMFGFESFESMEEPAGAGDYGYYLMRIEL